jgi:hypothetical protein
MSFIYNSQILNAINKSRPDNVINFCVIKNFMDDIKKQNTNNFNKLFEFLMIFLNEYGKGCIDYINAQYMQELHVKQHNENMMSFLCKSINTLCFTEEENDRLEKLLKHFDYT